MRDQYKILAEKYSLVTEGRVLSREGKLIPTAVKLYNKFYNLPDGPEFIKYLIIKIWGGDPVDFDDVIPNIGLGNADGNMVIHYLILMLEDHYFLGSEWSQVEGKTVKELRYWYDSFQEEIQARKSLEQQNKETGINLDI